MEICKVGTLVLAKVKGYPPWPAEIQNPAKFKQKPRPGRIFVFFFQPRQIRFCMPTEVAKFEGEAKKAAIARATASNCVADYKIAIDECLKVETTRIEAGENDHEANDEGEMTFPEESMLPVHKGGKRRKKGADSTRPGKRRAAASESDGGAHDLANLDNLFDIMKATKESDVVERAAQALVSLYEVDAPEAIARLLTCLFKACGCNLQLEASLDETDVDDVVQKLVEAAKSGDIQDYVGTKQKEYKYFKGNLLKFWDAVLLECQENIIFDKKLIDKCIDYVIALACTSPRTFRTAATFVGLQIVTSFVTVANTLVQTRETTQRQLNAEKRKKNDSAKVEALSKSLAEAHEKVTQVEEMMRKIFTGVFMHRYRDVDAEIRSACISSLGSWIAEYPSLFLQDLYLKYIGWTLNDKNAGVRLSSITALSKLYINDDSIPALGLFTERFLKRMIEMAEDVDFRVSILAIKHLNQLFRQELISDDDIAPLLELLTDEAQDIRQAVGDLIHEHKICKPLADSGSSSRARKQGPSSEAQLRQLLEILREYAKKPHLCNYVVDALWRSMDALQDWKTLIKMLLTEATSQVLSEEDTCSLICVLSAGVKKAVGEVIAHVDAKSSHIGKSQKEAFASSRKELTSALLKAFPRLLRKFLTDGTNFSHLAEIVLRLDLEIFSTKRQESSFTSMIELLKEGFLRNGEEEVASTSVMAMAFCAQEGHAELKEKAQQVLASSCSEVLQKLRGCISKIGGPEDDNEEEEEYSLLVNLRRLHQLQLHTELSTTDMFNCVLGLLEDFNDLDEEVIRLALLNLFLGTAWAYKALDPESPNEASVADVGGKRKKLLQHLHQYMTSILDDKDDQKAGSRLAGEVIGLISDSWSIFSEAKLKGRKIEDLGFSPTEHLLEKYWKLCSSYLKINEHKNLQDNEPTLSEEEEEQMASNALVVAAAAKLVAYDMIPTDYLAAEIVSHMLMHGKEVEETVKSLLSILKQHSDSSQQWKLHLEALKRAYHRYLVLKVDDEEDNEEAAAAFAICKALSVRLSAIYAFVGKVSPLQASIWQIVVEGVDYAFLNLPSQISFLDAAVSTFAGKLPPDSSAAMITALEKKVEGIDMDEDLSTWRPFQHFLEILRERVSKKDAGGDHKMPPPRARSRQQKVSLDSQSKILFGDDAEDEEEGSHERLPRGTQSRPIHSEIGDAGGNASGPALRRSRRPQRKVEQSVYRDGEDSDENEEDENEVEEQEIGNKAIVKDGGVRGGTTVNRQGRPKREKALKSSEHKSAGGVLLLDEEQAREKSPVSKPVHRGRGRPPKSPAIKSSSEKSSDGDTSGEEQTSGGTPPRRGRGRPRKNDIRNKKGSSAEGNEGGGDSKRVQRRRGRPPKNPVDVAKKPPSRGEPSSSEEEENAVGTSGDDNDVEEIVAPAYEVRRTRASTPIEPASQSPSPESKPKEYTRKRKHSVAMEAGSSEAGTDSGTHAGKDISESLMAPSLPSASAGTQASTQSGSVGMADLVKMAGGIQSNTTQGGSSTWRGATEELFHGSFPATEEQLPAGLLKSPLSQVGASSSESLGSDLPESLPEF